ncbi:fungal-specific transcription factor domain-containing protein [Tricladium varicosporioides]|nr:fungal-specific transcription factor domain-containing protein [Hymenoscyphus varicosporioides]
MNPNNPNVHRDNHDPPRNTPGSVAGVFNCHQCPKAFNRRENLSRHLKTHDAQPAHCCTKCSKAFTRSDLLRRHLLGHERWDKKEENGMSKRRKVVSDTSSNAINSSESRGPSVNSQLNHPQPHPQPHPHQQFYNGQPNQMSIPPSQGYAPAPPSDHPSGGYQTYPIQQPFSYRPPEPQHSRYDAVHGMQPPQRSSANFSHFGAADNSFLNFDFSSFMLQPELPQGNEWFSFDFYNAMRETGNYMSGMPSMIDPNLTPQAEIVASDATDPHQLAHVLERAEIPKQNDRQDVMSDASSPRSGRISRVSSPPNEASEEDKWAFQWNPCSTPILKAEPIIIPPDHALFQTHNPRYDITEQTLLKLKAFMRPPAGREFHQSQKGTFTIPPLPVVNVFIRLFFEHFSSQMPVLHHPTVDTNTDLPPPLLAVIVVIGAVYSHLKHARRFSIVLLDTVRWHLQIALECDNNLMRDPMIIYAEALICHTGLWCGNKRAFELAEVVRGALVTYIRRMNMKGWSSTTVEPAPESPRSGGVQAEWKNWIAEESQRRLYWVVYGIDCQFPSLLNLPATISVGEVSNLVCPCDDEFWCATSARNWKNLLGPASVPPSRSFSAAVGPFVLKTFVSGADQIEESVERLRRARLARGQAESLPKLDLNTWSAFLVLMTIQSQIFQFSQEAVLARTYMGEEESSDLTGDEAGDQPDEIVKMLRKLQVIRRGQLSEALHSWSSTYLSSTRSTLSLTPSSRHFHTSSLVTHHLATILLDVPLSDLQGAIGKNGKPGIPIALSNLTLWAAKAPRIAETVAYNAVRTIVSLAPPGDTFNRTRGPDSANGRTGYYGGTETMPYSVITLFLCHVTLWVFASVVPVDAKQRFMDAVGSDENLRSSPFYGILRRAMGIMHSGQEVGTVGSLNGKGKEAEEKTEKEKWNEMEANVRGVLFRCAAEMLTRLGTWGASLNLALLLHRRAEMD